jgi:hypothetical protein
VIFSLKKSEGVSLEIYCKTTSLINIHNYRDIKNLSNTFLNIQLCSSLLYNISISVQIQLPGMSRMSRHLVTLLCPQCSLILSLASHPSKLKTHQITHRWPFLRKNPKRIPSSFYQSKRGLADRHLQERPAFCSLICASECRKILYNLVLMLTFNFRNPHVARET